MSDYEQINLDIDGIETTIMTDRQTDRQTKTKRLVTVRKNPGIGKSH